jgi:hypothetical protein
MTNPAPIEFFKPGKHVDTSGKVVHVTADHLRATAAAYKPELHDAPLVVGHPKMDDPAYGWVKAVQFNEQTQRLEAIPHQVDADFAEIVKDGKYKKVSARFYLPDSPGNPVPGVYYPKHIGFLGATPPAVKGLKSVSFADDAEGVVEFADWDQMTIAGLFRSLRDWIISKDGIETADGILPTFQIESLQINAAQDDDKPRNISFSETSEPGEPMTPQEQAQMDALKAQVQTLTTQNTTLATQVASFAEAQKQTLHLGHVSFAESLIAAGKLLPADKDSTVVMLDKLAADESTVEFGEGDGKQSLTPLAIYKAQLEKAPKVVDFGEHAGAGAEGDDGTVSFAAPQGMAVSNDKLELHAKAIKYAQEHNVDFITAVKKVS